MNKTKYNEITDEEICLLACNTILEKCYLWDDDQQLRLYDLVIKGHCIGSRDNKTMVGLAFWLTRKLLFALLKKENKDDCFGSDKKDS